MRWFLVALAVLFFLDHGVMIGSFYAHAGLKGLGLAVPGLFLLLFWFYFFFIRNDTYRHTAFGFSLALSLATTSVLLLYLGVSTAITGGCDALIMFQRSKTLTKLIAYVQSENYCREFGLGLILLGILGIRSCLATYRERMTI